MGDPLILVDDLRFEYRSRGEQPVRALDGVSLAVRAGERLAVLGQNGSGKSTLAKHLNGLLLPTSGRVLVHDMDTREAAHRRAIRQTVGMVFQNPDNQLVATVVEEDVAFGPENLGLPSDEIRRRVDESLERVELSHLRLRPPHLLSGGQKQRVAIAGVLAMRPRVLVLDESTALLDPLGRAEVRSAVRRLHREGTTVVVVTHFMEEAVEADRIVVMSGGRIVLEGGPRDVFAQAGRLRELRLDVPQVTSLAERIHARLPAFPAVVLDVEEAAEAVAGRVHVRTVSVAGGVGDPKGGVGATHASPLGEDADDRARPLPDDRPIIEVHDLSHTYLRGTPLEAVALTGVDFELGPSEIAAIIGHTGSGKSTLVQHLNALLRPQRGSVRVGGLDLGDPALDVRQIRRQVGLVFQFPEHQLFEPTVGDDVAFGPRKLGCDRTEVRRRVREAMEAVGLGFEAFKDRYTFGLSGGEMRRVAIAGVLALEPRVLVLDEPTASLDPQARIELLETILRLRDERGIAVVFVSHNMEEVAELAERVWVIAAGKTALSGTVREVFRKAAELRALGLGVPQVARLMAALGELGLRVPPDVVTLDEAEAAVWTILTS
jgi:energy-coupling factor transport system ATP-binding protein